MKIPLYKQKKNTCGPTALRMVLRHFGYHVSESEIIKAIGGLKKFGVRTIELAEFAKRAGFNIECLSYNSKLAKRKAIIKRPNVQDILKFLKRKIPVMIAVRSAALYEDEKLKKMGHFIVITRHEKNRFWYNDPLDGRRHKIEKDKLMFAWHNNVLDSSAYFLAIWPK